jgi:2',3'-cyclic-nucleotide 2'-phosphodiesterase (5'-nucleotidase family)
MKKIFLSFIFCLGVFFTQAQSPFILWDFNSDPRDGNLATGSLTPAIGSGSLTLIGGVTSTFASGSASGGSSDTATSDNTALNLTAFPLISSNSGTAGVSFNASTLGRKHVVISWDVRHSNTASRWYKLQYSLDGTNFIDYTGAGTDSVGLYKAIAGDVWNNRKSAFLKGIAGVDNNNTFAFRLVTVFAPGTSAYEAARTTSVYAGGGTFRLDMVSLSEDLNVKVQILHASDLEAGLFAPIDAPGFAALVDSFSKTNPLTLKLSSGDNFIPSPFLYAGEDPSLVAPLRKAVSQYYAGPVNNVRVAIGRPDVAILDLIGLDAACLGNHEFDLGTSELNSIIGPNISSGQVRWVGAQFPYLSANLDFSKDPNLAYLYENRALPSDSFKTPAGITNPNQKKGLAPYTIIEKGGEKFGVIGATTTILQRISSPGDTKVKNPGADIEDMDLLAQVLQPYVDTLQTVYGINKIILLAHLQQLQFEEALATKLSGVDILIAGGNHTLCADSNDPLAAGDVAQREYPIMAQSKDNKPCIILNTGAEYKYLGRFEATFDANGDIDMSSLDSTINGSYSTDSARLAQMFGSVNAAYNYSPAIQVVKELCDSIASVIVRKDGLIYGKTNVFLEGRRGFVRTRETNLGNLSSDANLWKAKSIDPEVLVSLKNGGGIRSAIGEVFAAGSLVRLLPPQANPFAGKEEGDISKLDLENALRFNNKLSIVTVTAQKLVELIEHGVAASAPGATPGRFPQVGGLRFSFDPSLAAGSRVRNMAIVSTSGKHIDSILSNGVLVGDPNRTIKLVTLNFLAGGGDGYPFPTTVTNYDIGEQEAMAEYLTQFHQNKANAYNEADTSEEGNLRIQQLHKRADAVYTSVGGFALLTPANGSLVVADSASTSPVTPTWNRAMRADNYIFQLDAATGNFSSPLLALPSANMGTDTFINFTLGQLDLLLASLGVAKGDTFKAAWRVLARNSQYGDSALSQTFTLDLVRKKAPLVSVNATILAKNTMELFPNPCAVGQEVVIRYPGDFNVEIYAATGQRLASASGNTSLFLSTQSLSAGMYWVRLTDASQQVLVQKVWIE